MTPMRPFEVAVRTLWNTVPNSLGSGEGRRYDTPTGDAMSIARHHTTVEGLDIHWSEAGEGKPVILLHGWPTSSWGNCTV